jgi:hypothetical protein
VIKKNKIQKKVKKEWNIHKNVVLSIYIQNKQKIMNNYLQGESS